MQNTNIFTNEYNPFNKMKVLCWYNRMEAIKTGNFMAPVNIAIDLLQGSENKKLCGKGFACNFCMSLWKEHEEIAYIPKEILFELPEFWAKWGVRSICIPGSHSDPTMYPNKDLIQFLRLCQKWNIEIGFVTNGAYFNKHLMEEVARTCNWCGFSINAGTSEDHHNITKSPPGTFEKIIKNIKFMSQFIKEYELDCELGYKYLILDDNYKNIYNGIEIASKIGIRHFQLRPADLSLERTEKIDVNEVECQIKKGLYFERPGEFEVFGIREKFTPGFKKITPWKCIASPLGSTWKANGNVVICPDSRHTDIEPDRILGNFIKDGVESIRRAWGGLRHKRMIEIANEKIQTCKRCTSLPWHNLYREVIIKDSLDITLI